LTSNNEKIDDLKIVETVKDTKTAEDKLLSDKEEREKLSELRVEQSKLSSYMDALSELLRDTGIKTKVIRQYLPVMNKLINQYLQVLDFFVLFNLDESFNETIRSRHRDVFTYPSFSEGEKQRIDLSLLFAWRQIAKMKNSANTNLLILDETFDSSMDADGVDNLLKILYTLGDDTNVFIISHKQDMLEGKFPRKLEFEKVNNFSRMK
jgi:DNA repair exonuclease SbcCD ATPase subunit